MTKSLPPTEKELLLLLKQKSEKAFSYLYDQYAPLVYGLILKKVRDEKLASDILSSTFINILEECNNPECVKQTLFTWILKLAKQTAAIKYKVDIDFRSFILSQKENLNNFTQKPTPFQTTYNSFQSYS